MLIRGTTGDKCYQLLPEKDNSATMSIGFSSTLTHLDFLRGLVPQISSCGHLLLYTQTSVDKFSLLPEINFQWY